MVQIMLMLKVLFTQVSEVRDTCSGSSGSDPSLFFSFGSEPIQDDFQYDVAQLANEAGVSVVLASCCCHLKEYNNQRLSP